MKRFIVIVIDGFGIGAMDDTINVRPTDVDANTFKSILSKYPDLKLPNLSSIGLMNAYGAESKHNHFSSSANFGKSKLFHYGADTFLGHQEIMGTKVSRPIDMCINESIDQIEEELVKHGHEVKRIGLKPLQYLLVDKLISVADNIDSDLGQAINCIAPLDFISFEKLLEVGKIVRSVVKCNRVITFGGTNNTIDDILNAEETKENRYIGNVAVKTKSYLHNYQVLHLGYGVDSSVQAPTLLGKNGIPTVLLGKVADIVVNPYGKSISCVDSTEVLDLTIQAIQDYPLGFICTNVQETDLAGHSMNTQWYKELLEIVDRKLGEIIPLLEEQDVLVVMADHGNDPEIGHNRHTREYTPLLVYTPNTQGKYLNIRDTMADVGASACDYYSVERTEFGVSFLSELI